MYIYIESIEDGWSDIRASRWMTVRADGDEKTVSVNHHFPHSEAQI